MKQALNKRFFVEDVPERYAEFKEKILSLNLTTKHRGAILRAAEEMFRVKNIKEGSRHHFPLTVALKALAAYPSAQAWMVDFIIKDDRLFLWLGDLAGGPLSHFLREKGFKLSRWYVF